RRRPDEGLRADARRSRRPSEPRRSWVSRCVAVGRPGAGARRDLRRHVGASHPGRRRSPGGRARPARRIRRLGRRWHRRRTERGTDDVVRIATLTYPPHVSARDRAATARPGRVEQPIRAAELVGALSLATDLGTGQPLEHALRTAVLAVRLGELAGATSEELSDTYYVALLHASGCTSNSHEAAQLFGDDIAHRAAFFLLDPADPAQVLGFYRDHVGAGRPAEVREGMLEAVLANPARAGEAFAAMCEVAQRFAAWLGLGPGVERALEYVFARWDGRGLPREVGGEALPLPARLLHVARDVSLFLSAAGPDETRAVIERRAGEAYDPRLVELALRDLDDAVTELDEARLWEIALEREPFPQVTLVGDRIEPGFGARAALIGLKSPWLRGHCVGVADLAEAAAWRLGLPADEVTFLRRAALAHDLGRI